MLSARRHGATVRELSDEMGVVDKTIRRDLQFLASIGFPLTETVGEYGRKSWKLDGGPGVPSLKFNLTEVLSLYLARRFLEPLAGTNVWIGAQSAFKKIRATLGEGAVEYLDKLAHVFQQTPLAAGDYSKHAELIERLLIAIEDRKIVWVVYHSARATEPVSTEVYPLVLLWHRDSLYLLAHAREDDKVKTYKLDLISDVDVTSLVFNLPDDFDARQYLASSFGIPQGDGSVTKVRKRTDVVHIPTLQRLPICLITIRFQHRSVLLTTINLKDVLNCAPQSRAEAIDIARDAQRDGTPDIVIASGPPARSPTPELRRCTHGLVATVRAGRSVPALRFRGRTHAMPVTAWLPDHGSAVESDAHRQCSRGRR